MQEQQFVKSIKQYLNKLSTTVEEVDADVIINYDETNMTDDPGRKKVILHHGVKYADYIKDTSKSSTSVMFSVEPHQMLYCLCMLFTFI